MTTHKHINVICCIVLALTMVLTLVLMGFSGSVSMAGGRTMGYEDKLFDPSIVHTIEIKMDNWEEFLNNCKSEEYYTCDLVIDGETYRNIAIRGKGNTSLTQVDSFGNDRYSFKVEFDHYDNAVTYHGLDKLCLNNLIQDNTYMKDFLTYQMMGEMGVATPLCSYVYITVNGEDWGLYLAVEGVEESFLQRNYGNDFGDLYKPDSMNMGGGRGNGKGFDMEDFDWEEMPDFGGDFGGGQMPDFGDNMPDMGDIPQMPGGAGGGQMPDFGDFGGGQMPDFGDFGGGQMPDFGDFGGGQMPDFGGNMPDMGSFGGFGGFGSSDVLLKYVDDDADSYPNIFNSAKTNVTKADKKRLITALKDLTNGENIPDTVDIDAVIRYFVVHNFVVNFDSYTGSMIHNYYLYEEDGQMQMIPWDYNLAFGTFQGGGDATSSVNYPIDSPVSGGNAEDRPMIAWIFASEEYTELYHEYFEEFLAMYFDNGAFAEMLDDTKALISPYVQKDPTAFCTYEEFETGVSTLREFCLLRAQSVAGQLDGTIGSTTQTQNSSTLVDASSLNISDMGSMGFGGGKGGFGGSKDNFDGGRDDMGGNRGNRDEDKGEAPGEQMPDFGGDRGGEMPQFPGGGWGGEMPQFPGGDRGGEMPQFPGSDWGGEMPDFEIWQN